MDLLGEIQVATRPNLRQYYLADKNRIELRGDLVVYDISENVQLTRRSTRYGNDDYDKPDIGLSEV
ncbi:MtrB/PioB family outer membrane beta-barrel protein [Vibrio sp. M60_M31a]